MSQRLGLARIGCSGWQYQHWRGDFYPTELPQAAWLEHYASRFDTVELNNSFYRLPEASTFARWAARVPMRFVFAVKASRHLTHMKKLKEPEEPFKADVARLERFLQALPRDARHVLEFRDPSWYVDDVYRLMERHRAALCLHDMRGSATGRLRVGPLVYVRFHGPSGKYHGGYTDARLESWADWLHEQLEEGSDVYAYFNNDVGGHAPRDAVTLRRMIVAGSAGRSGTRDLPKRAMESASRD